MKITPVIGNGLKFGITVTFKGNRYFHGNNKPSSFPGSFKRLSSLAKSPAYIVTYVIARFPKANVLSYWKRPKYTAQRETHFETPITFFCVLLYSWINTTHSWSFQQPVPWFQTENTSWAKLVSNLFLVNLTSHNLAKAKIVLCIPVYYVLSLNQSFVLKLAMIIE